MGLIACVPRAGVGRFYHSVSIVGKRCSNVVIGKLRDYFPTAFPSPEWFSRINKRGVIVVPGFFNTFTSLEGVFISRSDQSVLSLGPTTCGLEFIRGSSTENVSDSSRKLYNINLGIRYVVMYGLPYVFLSFSLTFTKIQLLAIFIWKIKNKLLYLLPARVSYFDNK